MRGAQRKGLPAVLAGALLLGAGLPPAPTPHNLPPAPTLRGDREEERRTEREEPREARPNRQEDRPVRAERPLPRPVRINVDPKRLRPARPLDTIVTRSGQWRLDALPPQGDVAVYRMTLDANPRFVREFGCRRIFTRERRDPETLDLATVTLLGVPATVAQGACRVVQNMEPVAPKPAWLREAVAKRLIPAYRRERAWLPAKVKRLGDGRSRSAYDPTSLGPSPTRDSAPTGNSNFVGTTLGQGGEYTASRGFLHDADARVLDAALHDEDRAIVAHWPEFVQYTLYSLSQPQGAAWSARNHVTADPQLPLPGDRPYEIAFHSSPRADIDSMTEVKRWGRDVAHLENTGYVHWLLTEDPIAGLVVQRQAAYALGGFFEWKRDRGMRDYGSYTGQERGMFNKLSVLWKSRVVARGARSRNGTMLWPAARAERQSAGVIAALDRFAANQSREAKLAGVPLATVGTTRYKLTDGTMLKLRMTSAFQLPQYGKEPLWLWTRDGNATVAKWFAAYARHAAVRMAIIGGTSGVNGPRGRGSSYPLAPLSASGAPRIFPNDRAWGEWVAKLPVVEPAVRDSFDGAAIHTAIQMEGLLLLAKDAGLRVAGLDEALAAVARGKRRTTTHRYANLQMMKHLAAPR